MNKQAQRLTDHIMRIVPNPTQMEDESEAYSYASLPLCVIDAVFSIGIRYPTVQKIVTHFCNQKNWREFSKDKSPARAGQPRAGQHTIGQFLKILGENSSEYNAKHLFNNHNRTSSSSGILKAEAVQKFALALQEEDIDDFCDITNDRLMNAEISILQIAGQRSGISFDYFQMLAGDENIIKADRMVLGFIGTALDIEPKHVTPRLARSVLNKAIPLLKQKKHIWSARRLDHAIWKNERGR